MISRIKSIVEQHRLNNKDQFTSDRSAWIENWVVNFHQLLIDDNLNEIYAGIIKDKIAKIQTDLNKKNDLKFYIYESYFLYELFLLANREYQWIDETKLKEIDIEDEIVAVFKER